MFKYVVGSSGEEMNIPCQQKIKEYGITDEQLQICSYICLDNVIVKDRWGLSYLPQPDKVMKIDMSNIDVIIGINGHILYSKGQQR